MTDDLRNEMAKAAQPGPRSTPKVGERRGQAVTEYGVGREFIVAEFVNLDEAPVSGYY